MGREKIVSHFKDIFFIQVNVKAALDGPNYLQENPNKPIHIGAIAVNDLVLISPDAADCKLFYSS